MAESQKGDSSPVNSEKTSLLEVDFGKDFLSSWKSMSVAEDDAMDFDFGTISKGKKKAFSFDKLDVDFTLDGDLDKISSFKVEISDLDISSPPKSAGKSNERFKESAGGNLQRKQDCFTFPFEFNELDSFSFESSLMIEGKKSNKDQNSKDESNRSECQGSGTELTDAFGASEDGLTPKLPASVGVTTLKIDETLVGGLGDLASINKTCTSNSVRNENGPSKSATLQNKVASEETRTLPEKTTTTITEEEHQENHEREKTTSPEPPARETIQDLSVQSVSENESTQLAASKLQVEVCSLATTESSNAGGEQNVICKSDACLGFNCENPMSENSPAQYIARSLSNNGERNKFGIDNSVPIGYVDGSEAAQGDPDSVVTSSTTCSMEEMHDRKASNDNENANGKLHFAPWSREGAVDAKVQRGSKLVGISMSHSGELNRGEPVQPGRGSNIKGLKGVGALNGSKLFGSSRLHDREVTKGEPVQGSEKSIKSLTTLRSSEQTNALATQNCGNPRLPASSMVSVKNSNDVCGEGNKISPPKAGRSIPDLSSLKISRIIGANRHPSKSILRKEIKSLRNKQQNMELQEGSTASKMAHSGRPEKQTPPTPSLKRKTFEGLNVDFLTLNPSKRLSPTESRNDREHWERVVDKEVRNLENLADYTADNAFNDHQTFTPDIPQEMNMTELELVMENDVNVEKAVAYTKELEDICNLLKKKHEEAKEILVQAIVNNNKLLMLNHPIYEEKIRKVQKFAAQLMSKLLNT